MVTRRCWTSSNVPSNKYDDDNNNNATTMMDIDDDDSTTMTTRAIVSDTSSSSSSDNEEDYYYCYDNVPYLFELCRRWSYNAILQRCKTHPHELFVAKAGTSKQLVTDTSRGDTALHWVLYGQPPTSVVKCLIQVCPELCRQKNNLGYYPLHVACAFQACGPVIRALVEAYPEAALIRLPSSSSFDQDQDYNMDTSTGSSRSQDNSNFSPLDLLCYYGCQPESISALLECKEAVRTLFGCSSASARTSTSTCSPLEILHKQKNNADFELALKTIRLMRTTQRSMLLTQKQKQKKGGTTDGCDRTNNINQLVKPFETNIYWQKASAIMLAQYDYRINNGRTRRRTYTHYHLSPFERFTTTTTTTTGCSKISEQKKQDELDTLFATITCPEIQNNLLDESLLEFACLLYQDHMLTWDDPLNYGRLPLHVAIIHNSSTATTAAAAGQQQQPQQKSSSAAASRLILQVLQANPEAANVPDGPTGYSPLSLVLRQSALSPYPSFSTEVLTALIRAVDNPIASVRDALESYYGSSTSSPNAHYPFVLSSFATTTIASSSSPGDEITAEGPDILFDILRSNLDILLPVV